MCRLDGQIGVLSPGAFADVVVSNVDPLEHLARLADPDAVICSGRAMVDWLI